MRRIRGQLGTMYAVVSLLRQQLDSKFLYGAFCELVSQEGIPFLEVFHG